MARKEDEPRQDAAVQKKNPSPKAPSEGKRPPRPRIPITEELLKKVRWLGTRNATHVDAALFLGMSHQNFGRLVREDEKVKNAFESGRSHHRLSLRGKLTQLAMEKDNVAAAIFLAKQTEENGGLGMSDRQEHTGAGGGPISISFIAGDENL